MRILISLLLLGVLGSAQAADPGAGQQAVANSGEVKPANPAPDLAAADQLYRSGKFADAEAAYFAVLRNDPMVVAAHVGRVRSMLRQQKIDEAYDAVNAALARAPRSAALLAAKGDIQFRLGDMSQAELSWLAAKKLDPSEVDAYLGLARLYRAYSLYRKAYDEIQSAHAVAPDDPEVHRAWLQMLPRKDRQAALKVDSSGAHPDEAGAAGAPVQHVAALPDKPEAPVHACKLVSKVEKTSARLEEMYGSERQGYGSGVPRVRGVGLQVGLNGKNARLILDTGAGGILVSRKVAERSGLTHLGATAFAGIGDKGWQAGYVAVADRIRVGELEFQDCVVSVSEKPSVADDDGLIGADVFSAFLIDIDLAQLKLNLSPLPRRPDDAGAPTSLNSEGEEQANAEPGEGGAKAELRLPKDRYIAPEMANWTRVFRFGHALLVPTIVNDSKPMLFELDTGAFANIISVRTGRQVAKVGTDSDMEVRGLSGTVKKVYTADKAMLAFGHVRQPMLDIVTMDLSNMSRYMGTEISGFLGFATLRILDVKLDYRDGLVDITYDPKHQRNLRQRSLDF